MELKIDKSVLKSGPHVLVERYPTTVVKILISMDNTSYSYDM
jgi:hypothetical protein